MAEVFRLFSPFSSLSHSFQELVFVTLSARSYISRLHCQLDIVCTSAQYPIEKFVSAFLLVTLKYLKIILCLTNDP